VIFDDDDEDSVEELIDIHYKSVLSRLSSTRYLFRKSTYRNRRHLFDWDDCLSDESIRFSDKEFLKHFRVSRKNFWHLVHLIEDHDIFKNVRGKRKKAPVTHHVLVFLYRLGCQASGASNTSIGTFFGIGDGTVGNFIERTIIAITSLKDGVIVWPTGEAKHQMKQRFRVCHGFQQCIGIIDGTLIVLSSRPTKYGDSYYCRKNCYAINVQVVCDDRGKIQYFYGGWPGSTHDNRAWRNCKIYLNAGNYFGEGEYLLGDSAYSSSSIMVQAFKKTPGTAVHDRYKEFFNTRLAGARVKSEHCIGILKNRFPCLKSMNIVVDSKESIKEIMDIFKCCCILHNVFLNNHNDIPSEWYDDIDIGHYWTSDVDDCMIANGGQIDMYDRREAVFRSYIEDYYI
jgi:hypothetical protein